MKKRIFAIVMAVLILGVFVWRIVDDVETNKAAIAAAEEREAARVALLAAIEEKKNEKIDEDDIELDDKATKGRLIQSHVALRYQPDDASNARAWLQRLTRITVIEEVEDTDYLQVDADGKRGYILKDAFLEDQKLKSSGGYAAINFGDLSTNPGYKDVSLSYWQSIYPHCVGYIYSPNTPINYPIMWTGDDYYLHHDLSGNESVYGAIYLEKCNSSSFSDGNSILYGHHMKDGTMFASISGYKNSSYYYYHPVMYLYTPSGNYRVEVSAGLVVAGSSELFCTGFSSSQLDYIMGHSTFSSRTGRPTHKTITLCTCSYEFNDGRYIVIGDCVPIS